MQEVFRILNQINQTSSRNEKENILKQNKNNQLLRDILQFVYDPFIVTGLSTKKINKKTSAVDRFDNYPKTIEQMMSYLKANNTGKDYDICLVQEFILNQPEELQDVYTKIATKSLTIGITASTINKIYGDDFIPVFDVMLAEKYFEREDKFNEKFIVTEKLDGIRGVIIKENNNITIFSRQGQLIEGLNDIVDEAKLLPDNYVYDGELILINDKNLPSKDLYRETVKIVRKDGIKKNVIFNCFDIVPLKEFKKGISIDGCYTRKMILHNLLDGKYKWIKEVSILYVGEDKTEIITLLNKMIAQNKEGVMVNTYDGKYQCKRTKDVLKVKSMQDCDLVVIGFEEGEGQNKGTLGRINVEYKGNSIGVGSGFKLKTDKDIPIENTRDYIWQHQDKFIGKIAKVQYFEETTNSKDDKVSLRFPVFLEWRWDKTEPSYN